MQTAEGQNPQEAAAPEAERKVDAVAGSGPDGEDRTRGGELMPFDDGSMSSDKAQSSAMNLVINFADPHYAAGTAVFGLGLLVLPLLARLNDIADGTGFDDAAGAFSYAAHGEANPKQVTRLFTEAEMRQRLGLLDSAFLRREVAMSTDAMDDYMNQASIDALDDEVSKIKKWRDKANTNMRSLQKRSALAFLGLAPDADEGDINKMYKKMALELHPDKGGDPEKFQELQEMKERLNELEKDEDETNKDEADDEEARKAKEEEKKEEEEEKKKLPPDERSKKLRMDVHDNTTRLWERAKKSRDEITGDKAIKCNAQPALRILRQFVERFVNTEVKTLRHDDAKGAESKFRKFIKQGAEIIAVAAMLDEHATCSTIAMNFNYRIVARSGSPEIKRKCAALLEAVADVPLKVDAFIKELEDMLANQKDNDRKRKEAKAAAQKQRESRGDFGGDAADAERQGGNKTAAAKTKASSAPSRAGTTDPFGDFLFDDEKADSKASEPNLISKAMAASTTLKKRDDDEKSAIAAANQPKRTGWDPNFDHPYAGALKSNGTGVYCRPCQRWIMTYEYNTEVFLTHVERVHPKPPLGWAN